MVNLREEPCHDFLIFLQTKKYDKKIGEKKLLTITSLFINKLNL